jgi:hypothetical protein
LYIVEAVSSSVWKSTQDILKFLGFEWRKEMTDLIYIGLILIFLATSWGFIVACERLMEDKKK